MRIFKSLRGKAVAIVTTAVMMISVVMVGIFIPKQVSITADVIKDYMIDVAILIGESVDSARTIHGESVLEADALNEIVAGA